MNICRKKANDSPDLYKCLSFTDKAGSYATRNYAVKQAKGEILIFTDSDTKPTKDWIATIRRKICEGKIIAGKIELEVENGELWELYDTTVHLTSEENAKKSSVATANMAVLKKDFLKVGYFEERFSRRRL